MQFNRIFRKLMMALVLPTLIIAACSSKNSNKKNIEHNVPDNSLLTEQIVSQQLQKLQYNNIVYFNFNKYNIAPDYTYMLDQHAAFLRTNPSIHITIEGHTDERGTPEYNIALGERRANALQTYLQSKGVNGEQILIVSYGKGKPLILGHNELAYSKNRRAVLSY